MSDQMLKNVECLKKYVEGVKSSDKTQFFNECMQEADSTCKIFAKRLDKNITTTGNSARAIDQYVNSQNGMTQAMNTAQRVGKTLVSTFGNMIITLGASALINAAIQGFVSLAQAQEELRQKAEEASSTINSQTSAIDDYKTKITSLKESLDSGTLSESEAYDVRKQLISVQDDLADKYTDEAAGIDLVNGKLDEQIEKLDEIAQRKTSSYLNENAEAIRTAQSAMNSNMALYTTQNDVSKKAKDQLQSIVDKYKDAGLSMEVSNGLTNDYGVSFKIVADPEQAESTLSAFMDDVRSANAELDFMTDDQEEKITNGLSNSLQKAQGVIDNYKEIADTAAKYQIQTNATWSKLYQDLTDASDEYTEAVAKNDDTAIAEAVKKVNAAREALAQSNSFDDSKVTDSYVKKFLDEQSDQLEIATKQQAAYVGISEALSEYSKSTKSASDAAATMQQYLDIDTESAEQLFKTLNDGVKDINGLDDVDILDMDSLEKAGSSLSAYTDSEVQGFNNLKSAADTLGLSLDDLVDILVKLGMVTGESIKYTNDFTSSALTEATNASKAISLVTSALQTQSTTAGVSSDSYSELIKDHSEYAAALQYENGYMKLNSDVAKQLTQAKIDEAEADIKLAYSQNQMKYSQVKADLAALNKAVEQNGELEGDAAEQVESARAALENQSKQLRENCRNLQMQYSLLMQNSGAYQDWVNAQNATESGDMYDSVIKAKEAIAEGLQNGKIGTEKFKAAVELTIPEDYQDDVADYMKRLNRYFKQASDGSDDASGLQNFITDSIKAGLMSKDADDQIKIAANKTTKDFADALHLSMEDVQSVWGELQEYGWEFDWGSLLGDPLENYRMQIDDLKDQMSEMTPNTAEWDILNAQVEELQKHVDSIIGDMTSGDIDGQISDITQAVQDAGGVITDTVASAIDGFGRVQAVIDLQAAKDDLRDITAQYNQLMQSGDAKGASDLIPTLTEAQQKVTTLTQQYEKLGTPTELEVSTFMVDMAAGKVEGLNGDLEATKQALSDAGVLTIQTDDSATSKTKADVDYIKDTASDIEMSIDTAKAQSSIKEVQTALNNLDTTIPINFTVGVSGGIVSGISSAFKYATNAAAAKATGKPAKAAGGTASGGKTLVGELGNEIVVNPYSGKWYTVGDHGAEFVDLPRGAIVFNHEKTQKLLAQGFISGQGEAYAGGTAMASGGPSIDSLVSARGNTYIPGSNPRVKNTHKATTASTQATKDNTTALEENKKALEKQKTALEKQKDALEDNSNKLKIYGQAALNEIEKRINALNKEKDAKDKAYEAEKKQLQDKKQALQDANDEEDRAIKLAELKDTLEKARANRTTRIYDSTEGFVWRADQEAINEAQTNYDDQLRDWKREDILKAVDDEIDKIDELKDAYDESIDAEIDKLNDLKDQWNDVMSLIGTSWEDYQLGLEAAAHFTDMSFEGMTDDLVGYKDDVLANMQEIGDITDQIDSITESIEALDEAISNAKSSSSSGGSSGSSGLDMSADGSDVDTGLFDDLSEKAQETKDHLDELQESYKNLGDWNESLSSQQRDMIGTIADLTVGTQAYTEANNQLGGIQATVGANYQKMTELNAEYVNTVLNSTDLTIEQKDALLESQKELVSGYESGYDTIGGLIEHQTELLIESTDVGSELYQAQVDDLLNFVAQHEEAYGTFDDLLLGYLESVASNTELTNEQRQMQVDSIIGMAEQYGISVDEIIAKFSDMDTQVLLSGDTVQAVYPAMQDTVLAACNSMGTSYDTLAGKINAVTAAQKEMLAAIGNADFNTVLPLGTVTNRGSKIQWKQGTLDPFGHANGIVDSPATHVAVTDEKGPEIKIRKPSVGSYSLIQKGDSVLPADVSATLWKFGLDPESFISQHTSQRNVARVEIAQPDTGNVEVHVGDIQMYGVNDVDSFARVIQEKAGTVFAQVFSRRN